MLIAQEEGEGGREEIGKSGTYEVVRAL